MGDEGNTSGKRGNGLSIFLGIVGAVLGFVGMILLLELFEFGNRADPIASGLIALFVFGPIGAVGGLLLGTKLGGLRSGDSAGSFGKSSLKALAIVIGAVVVIGGGYALYAVATATPWLKPGGVVLQFEVRLPAGAAMPGARDVKADLQTRLNTMPAEIKPDLFRRDGDRPVIVGQVDLAFQTAGREIDVKVAGRMDRTYQIKITDKAPHADALGAWQPHPDGSEIRYRAKWPGRD